jgi:putative (di)nucleoside polyphosphate hydrolase
MTDFIDSDGFRANVGIILARHDGSLFLGRRTGQRAWQFPQGGIGVGEEPERAMYRELDEETGLSSSAVEILGSTQSWLRYRLPRRYRRSSSPKCIGQKQRWYLLRLTGSEEEFDLANSAEPEFDNWRWVDYWQPVLEVIYFKRRVYEKALREFVPVLFPGSAPPESLEFENWVRNGRRQPRSKTA